MSRDYLNDDFFKGLEQTPNSSLPKEPTKEVIHAQQLEKLQKIIEVLKSKNPTRMQIRYPDGKEFQERQHGLVLAAIEKAISSNLMSEEIINPQGLKTAVLLSTVHIVTAGTQSSETPQYMFEAEAQNFQLCYLLHDNGADECNPFYPEGLALGMSPDRDAIIKNMGSDLFTPERQKHLFENPSDLVSLLKRSIDTYHTSPGFTGCSMYRNVQGPHSPEIYEKVMRSALTDFPTMYRFEKKYPHFFHINFKSTETHVDVNLQFGTATNGTPMILINGDWFTVSEVLNDSKEYMNALKSIDEQCLLREKEIVDIFSAEHPSIIPIAWVGRRHEIRIVEECKKRNLKLHILRPTAAALNKHPSAQYLLQEAKSNRTTELVVQLTNVLEERLKK